MPKHLWTVMHTDDAGRTSPGVSSSDPAGLVQSAADRGAVVITAVRGDKVADNLPTVEEVQQVYRKEANESPDRG